jgi:hypothetical protein
MKDCLHCSVDNVCDECAEGFYWIEKWGECKGLVECTDLEFEEYISEE